MSGAVQEILQRIQQLPEDDRLVLQQELARQADLEWQREAENARQLARQRGIDQAAIDKAIDSIRYGK